MRAPCLLCANDIYDESMYCLDCRERRPQMVARLDHDTDLQRVLYALARRGEMVPRELFSQFLATELSAARAVSQRLWPMLDFFTAAINAEQMTMPILGVLWVDMHADLLALYRNLDKKTDQWKAESYNRKMLGILYQWYGVREKEISLPMFRQLREKGFVYMQSKS